MAKRVDAISDLRNGMNSTMDSVQLSDSQSPFLLNTSILGGVPRTRPAFRSLDVPLPTGRFQGAHVYEDTPSQLILSISGTIHRVNLETLSLKTYIEHFPGNAERIYTVRANDFLIMQDGTRPAFMYAPKESLEYRIARPDPINLEVPIGTVMAYGHQRLFVVPRSIGSLAINSRSFVAGDVNFASDPDRFLMFTETEYFNGGGGIGLPAHLGEIQAMAFMQNAETGTGTGSLIVLAENGASSFAVNAPRTQWQDIDISYVLFHGDGYGMRSPFSVIGVNNDLYYRGKNGLRSIGYSVSSATQQSSSIAADPISLPIDDIFDRDSEKDLGFVRSATLKGHIYMLSGGKVLNNQRYFDSIVVAHPSLGPLGFGTDLIVFDGIWTGLRFVWIGNAFVQGVHSILVLHKGANNENRLSVIDPEAILDEGTTRTRSRVYTRALSFEPANQRGVQPRLSGRYKRFQRVLLWLKECTGEITAKVYFRPYGYGLWVETETIGFNADPAGEKQSRRELELQVKKQTTSAPDTKENVHQAEEFEFCIELTGQAVISRAIFEAEEIADPVYASARLESELVTLSPDGENLKLDNYDYMVN